MAVLLDPRPESVVHALVFGLHGVAVFMLSFYRTAQSSKFLHARRVMFISMYMMFTVVTAFQIASLLWGPDRRGAFLAGAYSDQWGEAGEGLGVRLARGWGKWYF